MEKIDFYMEYEHTWIDHPLSAILYINNRAIHVDQGHPKTSINKKIAIEKGNNILRLEIQNKNEKNTKTNELGNIIEDSLIRITQLKLNEIDVTKIAESYSTYSPLAQEDLKQTLCLGLNGNWQLPIGAPIYDWLLEKLF